jgi:hypothetical protein
MTPAPCPFCKRPVVATKMTKHTPITVEDVELLIEKLDDVRVDFYGDKIDGATVVGRIKAVLQDVIDGKEERHNKPVWD